MKNVNMERAIVALTEYPTVTAAAEATNLSRRCLYNYLSDSDFRTALKHQREAQALERAEALSAAREAATTAIIEMLNDKSTPPAARLVAAKTLLAAADEADKQVTSILNSRDFDSSWG